MSEGGKKWSNGTAVAALVGLCIVAGIAMSSAALGALLVLGSGGLAVGVIAGRVPLDRRYAAIAGSIAGMALLGTCAGISDRARKADEQEQQRVASATRAREVADRTASLRSAAPDLVNRTRSELARARDLIAAGNFTEAHRIAESSKGAIAETAALAPPVDGAAAVAEEADVLFRDSANLSAISAALLDARSAKSTPPGDDVLGWSRWLETLATTLRQAPAVAIARYGTELTIEAEALDRQRARFRRQVERAQREETIGLARVALCGEAAPLVGGFDGELVGAERFVARAAHDPDSVDVENCTPPVLTTDACWISVCDVRAKNAFGALVLNRYRFSVGRAGILGATPAR